MKILILTNNITNQNSTEISEMDVYDFFINLGHDVKLVATSIQTDITKNRYNFSYIEEGDYFDIIWAEHQAITAFLSMTKINPLKNSFLITCCLFPFESEEMPGAISELSDIVVVSSEEAAGKLIHFGVSKAKIKNFHNVVPDKYVRDNNKKPILKKILIISNNTLKEVDDAVKILREKRYIVDFHKSFCDKKNMSPEMISSYDAIISTGRAVMYGICSEIPVYVYGRFGGPGWLTNDNIFLANKFDFSGKCWNRILTSQELVYEITNGFQKAACDIKSIKKDYKKEYSLDVFLQNIIDSSLADSKEHKSDPKILNIIRREGLIGIRHNNLSNLTNELTSVNEKLQLSNEIYEKNILSLIDKHNATIYQLNKLVHSQSWLIKRYFIFYKYIFRDFFRKIKGKEVPKKNIPIEGCSILDVNDYLINSGHLFKVDKKNITKISIISPPHTFFIATLLKKIFLEKGFIVDLFSNYEKTYEYDLYFVLCPQIYNILPPSENTILFQLEQHVSSKWFNRKYFSLLKSFKYILDYNIENISFLTKKGVKNESIYYLPVSANSDYLLTEKSDKIYDFLFYGDINASDHRKKLLNALSEKYRVKICCEIFGNELYDLIRQSFCVVNIHFYEDALLETPRIYEAISLGVPVLSEYSSDLHDYPELADTVLYFEKGSIDDMLIQAEFLLKNINRFENAITSAVFDSESRFRYMLNRALAGFDFIDKEVLINEDVYIKGNKEAIALSLPESEERRLSCLEDSNKLPSFEFFDGIRFNPGWKACGYSYKSIAQHLLKKGLNIATIFEDDAYLQNENLSDYFFIKDYLKLRQKKWDVFSGVIADLHKDTKIIDIEEWNGKKFVTITHMTSTVFNIYSKSGLKLLANWPSDCNDVDKNTIDRYLESVNNIAVVTTIPFIAGHKEDLNSTLWGRHNSVYNNMIKKSELSMEKLIKDYYKSQKIKK